MWSCCTVLPLTDFSCPVCSVMGSSLIRSDVVTSLLNFGGTNFVKTYWSLLFFTTGKYVDIMSSQNMLCRTVQKCGATTWHHHNKKPMWLAYTEGMNNIWPNPDITCNCCWVELSSSFNNIKVAWAMTQLQMLKNKTLLSPIKKQRLYGCIWYQHRQRKSVENKENKWTHHQLSIRLQH